MRPGTVPKTVRQMLSFSTPNPVYPDDQAEKGCGASNPDGYRIRSFAEGDEAVWRFIPRPFHTAVPEAGFGGLIASLMDCHGTGTAVWKAYRAAGRPMDSDPPLRFVTGSLRVNYRKPTLLGAELALRVRATEVGVRFDHWERRRIVSSQTLRSIRGLTNRGPYGDFGRIRISHGSGCHGSFLAGVRQRTGLG